MLFSIVFAAASLATLGSALPQTPQAEVLVEERPEYNIIPVRADAARNFILIENNNHDGSSKHWTSCWNRHLDPSPESPTLAAGWNKTMEDCLDNYNIDSWEGTTCGGAGWFKGPNGPYKEPLHCYHACAPCMQWLIDEKSSGGICWSMHGPADPNFHEDTPHTRKQTACHMGYSPLQ